MPTYDYVCDACQHKFELVQSIKADAIKKCPECKKLKLRRLIGAGGGLIFKGSGFYITDNRSESYKAKAASDAPKSDSGSSTKSESAPKAESKPKSDSGSKSSGDSSK